MKDINAFLKEVKQHPYIIIGGTIVIVAILMSLLAPFLTSFNPTNVDAKNRLLSPSITHPMGTDQYGRDIMSRVLFGTRSSIEVGVSVVLLTTILGGIAGIAAGYFPKLDNVIMRVLDGFMAFPGIIIAICLAAIWGAGKLNIILALSFAYFPKMARIVRSCVMTVKESDCVESARSVGAKNMYIIFKYILLNSLSPIIVQATFSFAMAILDEAALSFLGVGITPPNPSLGGMITDARDFMAVAPWGIFFPGFMIIVIVLGLNLLGDGLRDVLDPRLQGKY
ncbi:ABC transporter permease [Acetohalobium arabaticum]|uniref:Binding-protein-dependent transport systems inner membrane component n=1 Tax=Acetohalobium arabaticum (strain ATCC 49924 / DSM 5501 / Z-7288) TaxID=574087 RepID=D9QVB2_ACEAZ|nr:ABC transporter permease [Acetohalobium arabaticum]ADL12171.1 binding-protein-dependent transport systems inner membrane component [Acetohalobium arabaticum DSM 5501]